MKSILTLLLSVLFFTAQGQLSTPNIDFESGTTANWTCYRGDLQQFGVWNLVTCAPDPTLHMITNVGDTDYYCGFLTVKNGLHSVKIGKDSAARNADGISYNIRVPSTGKYMVNYNFAAVMQNVGGEDYGKAPRFEVRVIDSATGLFVSCDTFVLDSLLPIFKRSSGVLSFNVYYVDWTPGNINLNGMNGKTLTVDFRIGGCGGYSHWSYAYVDMGFGSYAKTQVDCVNGTVTITAPVGYKSCQWTDSATLTADYGKTAKITVPIPTVTTTYALIAIPYWGFGCADTLYTIILPSNLNTHKSNDTVVCQGTTVKMWGGGTDVIPMQYAWSPAAGLSCSTCDTVLVKAPVGFNQYLINTTDGVSCNRLDTVKVTVYAPPAVTANVVNATCNGRENGSIATMVSGGSGHYQYLWENGVVSASLEQIGAGSYTLYLRDSASLCNDTSTYVVKQPDSILAVIDITNDLCKASAGKISIVPSGGTTPYHYLWSTDSTGDHISRLLAATYTVTVTDANTCSRQFHPTVGDDTCYSVIVPDVITPNGDGINDVWVIQGLQSYPANTVQIFDKWGDLVYEKTNYSNDWTGQGVNGRELPSGTYFYLLQLNAKNLYGSENVFKGAVLIKR